MRHVVIRVVEFLPPKGEPNPPEPIVAVFVNCKPSLSVIYLAATATMAIQCSMTI
jgi:hypothetical protein